MRSLARFARACAAAVALLAVASPAGARAAVRALCARGCEPVGAEHAVNLILRESASADVTLAVESDEDPATFGAPVAIFAGNPAVAVRERAAPAWRRAGAGWRETFDVPAAELGSGTYLVVTLRRPPGKPEEILDWRVFRLWTTAQRDASRRAPAYESALSIDVKPALLTAHTGHGDLPRRSGEALVWWGFEGLEGNTADVDLDGDDTGIPGLAIQVASPWHTTAGEDWKDRLKKVVTGDGSSLERFEDFEWLEQPDRTLDLPGGEKIALRNYYTVITLHTAATARRFDERSAGGHNPFIDPDYFSHETSARLDPPYNPLFFASYSEREHGANPTLLGILRTYARSGRDVPGLGTLQTVDGDGGTPRFTVGFYIQVKPWETPGASTKMRAGLVAMDIVAARVGVGGVTAIRGDEERSVFCKVIRCGQQGGKGLRLDAPPSGYSLRGAPYAQLGSISGALRLTTDPPDTAPRAVSGAQARVVPAGPDVPRLPREARFGLTADLRAGLLTRDAWFGQVVKDVYPINTYAQYVVRATVAMTPDTVMVAADSKIFPSKLELSAVFVLMQGWLERLRDWIAGHAVLSSLVALAIVVAILAVLSVFFPVLRPVVSLVGTVLGGFVKLVRRVAGAVLARKAKPAEKGDAPAASDDRKAGGSR